MKEKIIKIARKIFSRSPIPTFVVAISSFALLIVVLTGRINLPILAYTVYALSAYALVGITILAIKKNEGFTYVGYLIYVIALYAFYAVITAVINLIKYRKYGSPVLSAAKVVNMSTALVSMFSLETAMLVQFGKENTEQFRIMMTAFTGAGVILIVVGIAVYMIIRSSHLIKSEN